MIILAFTVAFLISSWCLPQIIKWAQSHQQFEQTDERKTHQEQISAFGGVGILVTLVATASLPVFQLGQLWYVIPALIFVFGISLWDDLENLPASFRLFVQIMLASWLYLQGWAIDLSLSYPITLFVMLLFINAYNFIDGINGLSGTLGVLAMGCFAVLFFLQGMYSWACFCATFVGAISGFLRFNFGKKAQIFMGDNGSTVLGLSLAVCFIQLTQQTGSWSTSGIIASSVVALPLLDVIRIASLRVWQRRSPFQADRQHFHHLLVDHGWTAPQVCLFVAGSIVGIVILIPLFEAKGIQLMISSWGMLQLYIVAWWKKVLLTADPIPAVKDQKIVSPAE